MTHENAFNPNFVWTDELVARGRTLWDEGHSARIIGDLLGCGKNALIGKAHRLRWPTRPSPIAKGYFGPRRPKSTPAPIPRVGTQRTIPLTASEMIVAKPKEPPTVFIKPPRIDATRSCQWIDGDATRRARFCDAPVLYGSSYCPQHHQRCWVKPIRPQPVSEIGPVPMRGGRAADRLTFLPSNLAPARG